MAGGDLSNVKPFTPQHLAYVGWNAAIHALMWCLVLVWATLFNLLKEENPPSSYVWWTVGTAFYAAAVVRTTRRLWDEPEMWVIYKTALVFFLSAMFCLVCAGTVSYHYKLGEAEVLPDVFFNLIPPFEEGTLLSKLSGTMAVLSGLFVVFRQLVTCQSNLPVTWFRCMAVNYLLRAMTLGLTSLPGPASHCRGFYAKRPLNSWAILGRLSAMYGGEENCGDLIFSGHTAFVTTSMLALLYGSGYWQKNIRNAVWAFAATYLVVFMYLCLGAHKHYSVDVWLGFLVASFVFHLFCESWTPPFISHLLFPGAVEASHHAARAHAKARMGELHYRAHARHR